MTFRRFPKIFQKQFSKKNVKNFSKIFDNVKKQSYCRKIYCSHPVCNHMKNMKKIKYLTLLLCLKRKGSKIIFIPILCLDLIEFNGDIFSDEIFKLQQFNQIFAANLRKSKLIGITVPNLLKTQFIGHCGSGKTKTFNSLYHYNSEITTKTTTVRFKSVVYYAEVTDRSMFQSPEHTNKFFNFDCHVLFSNYSLTYCKFAIISIAERNPKSTVVLVSHEKTIGQDFAIKMAKNLDVMHLYIGKHLSDNEYLVIRQFLEYVALFNYFKKQSLSSQ